MLTPKGVIAESRSLLGRPCRSQKEMATDHVSVALDVVPGLNEDGSEL